MGPKGVLDRCVHLTSVKKSWLNSSVEGLFPYQIKAMMVAGNCPDKFPSIPDVLKRVGVGGT